MASATTATSRDSLDLDVEERDIDRSQLYAAEEAFFCGTGWEVTPITSIDKVPVGAGKPGALTLKLQKIYFDVVLGKTNVHAGLRESPIQGGGVDALHRYEITRS